MNSIKHMWRKSPWKNNKKISLKLKLFIKKQLEKARSV
jgi:hypothetical protein